MRRMRERDCSFTVFIQVLARSLGSSESLCNVLPGYASMHDKAMVNYIALHSMTTGAKKACVRQGARHQG